MPGPLRIGDPLGVERIGNLLIVGHGIVVRSVEEMSPLVDVFRPGFLDSSPGVALLEQGDAAGAEDS